MKRSRSSKIWILSVLTLILSPAVSVAAVITFDETPLAFQQGYGEGSRYEEGDYFFSTVNDPGRHGSIIRFNPNTQMFPISNNGSVHMGFTYFSNPWMQRIDGGEFDLIGLQLGEYSQYVNNPSPINITGTQADGTILSADLSIDGIFDGLGGISDFESYTLNWTNLVRVDFNDNAFAIDNVLVQQSSYVAVSEPASLAILALGLAMLGANRRKV